jgi:hypothetical protein
VLVPPKCRRPTTGRSSRISAPGSAACWGAWADGPAPQQATFKP